MQATMMSRSRHGDIALAVFAVALLAQAAGARHANSMESSSESLDSCTDSDKKLE